MMGMIQNENDQLGQIEDLGNQEGIEKLKEQFKEIDEKGKLYIGDKGKLERYKFLVEKIDKVEKKINRLLLHFDLAKDQILEV